MTNIWLSATQVDNYRRCPRYWAWDKIARIPREPSQSLELGTRVHDILEAYYQGKKSPDLNEVWRFSPTSALYYPGRIASGMISEVIPPSVIPDLHAEMSFKCETLTPGIIFVGKIDVHWIKDGTIHIVDHKTSSEPSKWGKKKEQLEKDTQKILYSAVLSQIYPDAKNVIFALNYGSTKLQYKKNYFAYADPVSTKKALEQYKEEIEPFALEMAELKRQETDPLTLEPCAEACEMYGGCEHKTRCQLTTQQRIGGLMKGNSKVAELLAKAKKNKNTEDKINPPDEAPKVEETPKVEEIPKVEETPKVEEKPKKEKPKKEKPKKEKNKTVTEDQRITEREIIFANVSTLYGIVLGMTEERRAHYAHQLRDGIFEALDKLK